MYKHFLGIDELKDDDINYIIDKTINLAKNYKLQNQLINKAKEKKICHLFFEASTRTRVSFEMAAHRLGYKVFDGLPTKSSISKGETILDTVRTIKAIGSEACVIRHINSGTAHFLAKEMEMGFPIINAGDGSHEHPTQALLDASTIILNKGKIKGLTITFCGDINHSRVASSGIRLLKRLGANIRIWAPGSLFNDSYSKQGIKNFSSPEEALADADIVMVLRLQNERMTKGIIPSLHEYKEKYRLTKHHLKFMKKNGLIFHPGPQNRGVEITSDVLDDKRRARIEQQVEIGVLVRMVVLQWVFGILD